MTLPKLIVFDMIGTTVQATDRIPEAFSRAFDEQGISLTGADIDSVRGKSKRDAIRELLAKHAGEESAPENTDRVYEAFKERLIDCYRDGEVNAIDGAEATFDWCRVNDIKIALTTGFDHELAELLVNKLGWSDTVDALICNDDVESGRPAPDLILCAMRITGIDDVSTVASVGDTISDLEAGANAGTSWNVGVLSGAHSRDQLESVAHTAIINNIDDLPQYFRA